MELTYRMVDGYRIPNLTVPDEGEVTLGRFGLRRREYLKAQHPILFTNLLTQGKLNEHLMEIEQTARQRMELTTAQMAAAQGVTEELKQRNQMRWVGLMNNIRQAAEETVNQELIYA